MDREYRLFGLQRSGTNYLDQLIDENFENTHNLMHTTRMWKHRINPPKNIEGDKIIVIYKNPYKWIESIIRNAEDFFIGQKTYDCKVVEGFDESAIVWKKTKGPGAINGMRPMNLVNSAKVYKHHTEKWVFSNKHFIVRYEDLLLDESKEAVLDDIGSFLSAKRRSDMIREPVKVPRSTTFTGEKRRYFLSENNLKCLTEDNIEQINSVLDIDFLDKLKYIQL